MRASASPSPVTVSPGRPASSSWSSGWRAAKIMATGSASSRRAANARHCTVARSSHCASSTRQASGWSSAVAASRLSTASPTRNRSGAGPSRMPNATASASRCGPGSWSSRPSIGTHSWCSPANASSISDSTPQARTTRNPTARPAA